MDGAKASKTLFVSTYVSTWPPRLLANSKRPYSKCDRTKIQWPSGHCVRVAGPAAAGRRNTGAAGRRNATAAAGRR